MKKYFCSDGTIEPGPFSIEELKQRGITPETKVRPENTTDWIKAGDLAELKGLFITEIPNATLSNIESVKVKPKGKNRIDLFLFIVIAYWFVVISVNFVMFRILHSVSQTERFVFAGLELLLFVSPLVLAFAVRSKALKITAIIIGALLAVLSLVNHIGSIAVIKYM